MLVAGRNSPLRQSGNHAQMGLISAKVTHSHNLPEILFFPSLYAYARGWEGGGVLRSCNAKTNGLPTAQQSRRKKEEELAIFYLGSAGRSEARYR